MIICFSRCLYCGIRTPHEVCHRCRSGKSRAYRIDEVAVDASPNPEREWALRWDQSHRRTWERWFNRPPEVCPPTCKGIEEDY